MADEIHGPDRQYRRRAGTTWTPRSSGALFQRIATWWDEHRAAGEILEGRQLQPAETATTVRLDRSGEVDVTDGPFVEGKEMVGGYAVIDVPDLDAAISHVAHLAGARRRARSGRSWPTSRPD